MRCSCSIYFFLLFCYFLRHFGRKASGYALALQCRLASNIYTAGWLSVLAVCLVTEQLKITEVPENATLQLGSEERIVCRADGKSRPRVRWYRDGRTVQSEHVRQTTDGGLYFSVVESGDAGLYVCVATNEQGTVNASVRVDVVGKYRVLSSSHTHTLCTEYIPC